MAQIVLGSYPARRCARLTHNQFDPAAPALGPVDPARQQLIDAGRAFEGEVVAQLVAVFAGTPQLLVVDAKSWDEATAATLAAIAAGIPVIAGARLPNVNGRSGAPDLLIRYGDGYLPVDVKNHKTLTSPTRSTSTRSRAAIQVSTLGAPGEIQTVAGFSAKTGKHRDDAMQLAHYTRMLQDLGHHPSTERDGQAELLIGGIIGPTDLSAVIGGTRGIIWHRLGDPVENTGTGVEESVLARYDRQFAHRLQVAQAARAGDELVRPLRIPECNTCDWFAHCAQVVGAADASFALETGHLQPAEWHYLYTTAGSGDALTLAQLADVDVAAHADAFSACSSGGKPAQQRLTNAVRRAAMTVSGIDVEPHGPAWPEIPSADIEVDFDIEWDGQERVYQWGIRVRDGQDESSARYLPVVSFAPLDDEAEAALADEFADRLIELIEEAKRTGKSIKVFHWSPVEITKSARFPRLAAALSGITVDLMAWFNREFFARTSSSIKSVAPLFGFAWDADDADGLTSLLRIQQARGSGPEAAAAQKWCLRYNAGDVEAQAAIRDGLRRLGAECAAR